MNFNDISFIFNRAFSLTFSKKKLLVAFIVLALCGLLVVVFKGLALDTGEWMMMSLTFLPIFLCAGVLFALGIFLIRVYHHEIKQRPVRYRDILANSLGVIVGASYFCVPIILSYLLLWIMLGIFMLLRHTPALGEIFGVVLSFAPFLLNLGSIILCFLSLAMLFFIAPIISLKGLDRIRITETLVNRFRKDVFSNILLILIAMLPLIVLTGILVLSAFLTGRVCSACEHPLHIVLQWFFIMIPFTALLSPAVVFFFNFAAESHVLLAPKK